MIYCKKSKTKRMLNHFCFTRIVPKKKDFNLCFISPFKINAEKDLVTNFLFNFIVFLLWWNGTYVCADTLLFFLILKVIEEQMLKLDK